MNVRCSFCQTPYTLGRVALLDALQEVDANNLSHYDAHCPRCRRATPIPRQRLEMAMPNWRDELKQFEKDMKAHPQQEAPLPKPEATPVAEPAPAPEPARARKAVNKTEPAATATEEKSAKSASRQTTASSETRKSTAKKTATKRTSKKSK